MVFIRTPLIHDRSRDKALLIGVQYDFPTRNPVAPLSTPHRDVRLLKDFLVAHEGYLTQNIAVLMDDAKSDVRPTKANIEAAIEAFVEDVQPGDRRVFFFAGHGYQIISRTGTEDDNKDEVILTDGHYGEPLNADKTPIDPYKLGPDHPDRKKLEGIITDNFLREKLVDKLPPGARLVAIFDTCHSGTMLDLDYHWSWQHFRSRSRKSGSGYEMMSSRRTTVSLYSVSRVFAFVRKIKRTATKAQTPVQVTGPPRGRSSAKWTPDDGLHEQQRSSSPVPVTMPELSEELSSYGPVAANVLSISSAMDSQRAWGGKHTMLSVLLDILRESKEGQRSVVSDIMESLQKKTCEFRINAIKTSLEARGKKQRTKSAIAKIKAFQLHQFGSLSPWAAEHELIL